MSHGCFGAVVALAALAAAWPAAAEVDVSAVLERSRIQIGDATALVVRVRGAGLGVGDPEFNVPPGVEVLSRGRSQSFRFVNGQSTSETAFRYEIGASAAGNHALGPFRVTVNKRTYEAPSVVLAVTAASQRVSGSSGGGAASLIVHVEPESPWVGEPVTLRVRLIQRSALAEDPQYVPPSTPGFWSGPSGRPESYYAEENRQRVLVTEARSRLYPLASGEATIGEAVATLALAGGSGVDPLAWLRGRSPRREVVVRSAPLRVRVRPLPPGAPSGFDGAVGDLAVRFVADRARTSRDVPATVWLDVRGVGNLPLLQPPAFASEDFEVFAATVDDSFGPAGSEGPGRRRFQWTVLPRRMGRLTITPPEFAWFDPRSASYRRAGLPELSVEVGPPLHAGEPGGDGFPTAFAGSRLDPFARPALPWAWAIAGFALGGAVVAWRRGGAPPPDAGARARQRELLRSVGLLRGADFWREAGDACRWLESRGAPVQKLASDIAAARYGGAHADPEGVRRRLVEQIGRAVPPASPTAVWRVGAVGLAGLAVAALVLAAPQAGPEGATARAREADRLARDGDVGTAEREWRALWSEGARHPALAARLAWARVAAGRVGEAAAWVLRGRPEGARDPGLRWVSDRVRESGGLAGAGTGPLPMRAIEWSALALLAGLGSGLLARRTPVAVACVAVALACAAVPPLERLLASRIERAVVGRALTLEGPDLELDEGQVVVVRSRGGDVVRVSAARGVEGTVPADALIAVRESS
jgi:hypothetical protein